MGKGTFSFFLHAPCMVLCIRARVHFIHCARAWVLVAWGRASLRTRVGALPPLGRSPPSATCDHHGPITGPGLSRYVAVHLHEDAAPASRSLCQAKPCIRSRIWVQSHYCFSVVFFVLFYWVKSHFCFVFLLVFTGFSQKRKRAARIDSYSNCG